MKEIKTVEYQRRILANNIQRLLDKKGKTQTDMARDLGLAETTVSSWMNCERYPRLDKIQLLANYFRVNRSDITEEKTTEESRISESSFYPYYPTAVSAGLLDEIDPILDENVKHIDIPDCMMGKWAGYDGIYITHVNGESMNKVIPHGSLIAVKKVETAELQNNDIVVYSNHGEFSVKRLYNDKDNKRLIFRPDSSVNSFVDYIVPYSESDSIKIHGKVVVYMVELN